MVNEIVKFSNQFNNVALKKFDAANLDVLMAIAARVKERGSEEVVFSFEELRHLMRLNRKMSNRELAEKIVQTNARLLALNYMFTDSEGGIVQFALFTEFRTLPAAATLTVSVNQKFAFLLNDLTSQFTRFELAEFTGLSSRYAKEFYRRAKQYRSTGLWMVSREEFCRLLDVPKATAESTTNLNKKVLRPIVEECGPLLGLQVQRRYTRRPGSRGRGALSGFVFMFLSEEASGPSEEAGKDSGADGAGAVLQFSERAVQRVMEAFSCDPDDPEAMVGARRRALALLRGCGSVEEAVRAARLESQDGQGALF